MKLFFNAKNFILFLLLIISILLSFYIQFYTFPKRLIHNDQVIAYYDMLKHYESGKLPVTGPRFIGTTAIAGYDNTARLPGGAFYSIMVFFYKLGNLNLDNARAINMAFSIFIIFIFVFWVYKRFGFFVSIISYIFIFFNGYTLKATTDFWNPSLVLILSFITYINQILMSMMMLSMIFVNVLISSASLKRIVEVLEEDIDIKDGEASSAFPVQNGSVEFKNVSFSYKNDPNSLVLENINVKIKAGETIGIIGGTGSSKSTFVQLIPRLYDVTEGSVLIDGRNVKDIQVETLRNSVSMVLQKNVLFSGTILENLRWGDQEATKEQCIEACKVANAHDFIMGFPDGYDTYIEQGGTNVSGGQKQRLCIARALLKHPKILILDDSTSAVDTATDASIRKELRENLKGMTTIIIAQRISSVQDADRIFVFDEGKINDIGTHDELLGRNPIYQEVYRSQMKGVVSE